MSAEATASGARVWAAAQAWHGVACAGLAMLADRRLPPAPAEG